MSKNKKAFGSKRAGPKNKKTGTSKITLDKLFKNNKFLLVFSFLMACILWLFFSQNSGVDTTASISDIPISIQLSDQAKEDGLVIFTGADTKATVQISGNRLTLGTVTKEDIQVVAEQAANTILTPNTYSLELTAKNNSVKTFKIESVSPQFASVYVDRYSQKTLEIQDKIEYKVDPTYYAASPILSTDKITVSGPQSEVLKVASAEVIGTVDGVLTSAYKNDYKVILYDAAGGEIKNELITTSADSVTVTISVLPKKKLPVEATFTNVPAGFHTDSFAKLIPDEIEIAGPEDTIGKLEAVELEPIDFTEISPANTTFTREVDLPNGCKNISNITQVTVTLDLSGYSTTRQTVKKFNFKNLPGGYTATPATSAVDVTIVGPDNVIEDLSSSDLSAVIDLKSLGQDFVGSTEVPVTIEVTGVKNCWAYSRVKYTANITVSKNE